jgi:hypothetical protein
VKDREIDDILKRAAGAPHDVDPALLDRIAGSIGPSLRPVRPLPPAWTLTAGLVLVCAGVAVAGAAKLGLGGVGNMDIWERVLIFPALGALIWCASEAWVGEMIPGSRRRMAPAALLGAASLLLLILFAGLFHDYRTTSFVHQGLVCLSAGLFLAVPTAFGGWLILRRGFAVNAAAAGLAAGILAGLGGVTMLELHCVNFQALHLMLWHTAVLPLSAAMGALLAWRFRRPA